METRSGEEESSVSAKSKSVPARPAPRLYLATPVVEDPSSIAAMLSELLANTDVAAVLVRLAQTDERTMTERAKVLARSIQSANVAFLLEGQSNLVARAGADGAHLTGID